LLLDIPEESSSLQASDQEEGAEAGELVHEASKFSSRDVHTPGVVLLVIGKIVGTLGYVVIASINSQQDLVVAEEAAFR